MPKVVKGFALRKCWEFPAMKKKNEEKNARKKIIDLLQTRAKPGAALQSPLSLIHSLIK